MSDAGPAPAAAEGRGCAACRRLTAAVLFPRVQGVGAWLLALAAVCAFVLVKAFEVGTL